MNTIDFPKEIIFDKELNEEELELIKSEYKKLVTISKTELDNNSYQLFLNNNNKIYLPKGTLIHFTNSNLNNLKYISKNGLLPSEFQGIKNSDNTYYSTLFYKVNKDILLVDYLTKISNDNDIAFIVNPTSKIGGLLYYDLLDKKFDNNPIVKNIISSSFKENNFNKNNLSLILVGVPSNAISGIIVGDSLLMDKDIIDRIKKLFPNAYIVSKDGIILKDRSNIIKIEDYDDIAFSFASVKANNKILNKDIDLLKKDIKKIIEVLKDNTSYYQQAKIFKELGYKLPKGLKNKLTEEELKELTKK